LNVQQCRKLGVQVAQLVINRAIQRSEPITLTGREAISKCEQQQGHRLGVF
jgi:hypothetical protein